MVKKSAEVAKFEFAAPEMVGHGALARQLASASEELRMLYAALDNVESGLLLLDRDLHARYSNPALHALFSDASTEYVRAMRPP